MGSVVVSKDQIRAHYRELLETATNRADFYDLDDDGSRSVLADSVIDSIYDYLATTYHLSEEQLHEILEM